MSAAAITGRAGRSGAIVRWLLCAVALVAVGSSAATAAGVGPGPDASLETRAKWLEARLMAPCCRANPVADHHSGPVSEMRREIRAMLGEGADEQAILDHYVAQYGEQILAMPRSTGFGLVAYLAPIGMMFAGGLFVVWALARWRRREPVVPDADRPGPMSGDDADRLQEEIRRFG